MENKIEVPLHEYEELIRDSEKLRIIEENVICTRGNCVDKNFIMQVIGRKNDCIEPPIPIVRTMAGHIKESLIDKTFQKDVAEELKKQIKEEDLKCEQKLV